MSRRNDAEDVFQQTSLVLWQKWDRFDPQADFTRWACGIAHNEIRNFIRKQSRQQTVLSSDIIDQLTEVYQAHQEQLDHRREALIKCMEQLPRQHRAVTERCYSGEETIKQVATKIGISSNKLYMLLKRVRKTLFECINRKLQKELS